MIYGAIHRDEGHLNDEGQFVKNTHFQVLFISLDENGNSMHRITRGKRQLMRDIQTEVARVLNMERGIDKRISGREHLTLRQYKQAVKLQEPIKQALKLTKDELEEAKTKIKGLEAALKAANLAARNELKEQGASRPGYAKLEDENAKLKDELAAFKKTTDNVSVDDFVKLFEEKIKKLRHHPKIDNEVKKAIKSNGLRSTILGDFKKEDVLAYVADAVATRQAAINTIKDAQAALKKATVKKEIDVYEQLKALRENKIAQVFLGAASSKPDVDVDALRAENASLLKTFDVLQKQNKDLKADLRTATDLVKQKDSEIAKLQKNQVGVKTSDESFFQGQAALLSELVCSGMLYVEPKGRYLIESLDGYLKGEYPSADSFAGIKSGLLSYIPQINQPENGLKL
ncbi:mobilization protein [uncultured Campylobacter sp.]|uniref:mobilization protein n=1 Tax=uncultured Campylobacter sp. TaxID=218934 RepID=UPI0026367F63|nr:mobilization protein [uncultured Campylobacter sp.]